MSTATLPPAARPLPKLPNNAHTSFVWRGADGRLEQHDVEMPVEEKTHRINGRVFACPVADCSTGEWVIEPATAPRNRHCPADGQPLIEMHLDDTERDPIPAARQRMLARVRRHVADQRDAAAARIRATVQKQADEAKRGLSNLSAEMYGGGLLKGHLPSLAATAVVEIGVVYVVDLAQPLESMALGAAIGTWGAILGYLMAVWMQKQWARWVRKEPLQGRSQSVAHRRALYAGKALAGTGMLFGSLGAIDALYGLNLTSGWQAAFVGVLTLGLAWLVNRDHWDRLWAARRRIRELAEQNARRAAEAEAARLAAEAERLREEARLREQLADVGAYDENNPEHQGERMRIEWERIGRLPTAVTGFPKIGATRIQPAQTREITAPDPDDPKKKVRIGWEYLGTCEPGALVAQGGVPPILAAKEWIVSVLFDGQYDGSAINVIDKPEGTQNTFLIMITERARLGQAVAWNPETAVQITDGGNHRTGYLGRSLTGDDLEEVLYHRGQTFGGLVTGASGNGKGGFAVRYLLNLLHARIFPLVFDPKELVDYGDFAGLFPMGFTKRHRRMILAFLHAERSRRQKVVSLNPKTNRYGARIAGESKWQHRHDDGSIDKMIVGGDGVERLIGLGEPMLSLWDEFHDLARDDKFVLEFTNHVRFQRVAGMGALVLTQGGGLEDLGNSVLREQVQGASLTNFRSGEMSARLSGNRNATYSVSDLPMLPGMCLRQAPGSPQIPLRAAFVTRDADAEDTVYTIVWGKGAEREMQIEDPLTWISEETVQIMKDTGVWDLWMLAREGGLEALLADTAEDPEDDDETAFVDYQRQVAMMQPKEVARQEPAPRKMQARDVLLAILHETPGLDRDGIATSDGWARAGMDAPADETITRAAKVLDPTVGGRYPLQPGQVKKIDRGPGSKSWTVMPEYLAEAAELAARLAPQAEQQQGFPGGAWITPGAMPAGMGTAAVVEMAAQRAAEMAQQIAAEQARIMAGERGR